MKTKTKKQIINIEKVFDTPVKNCVEDRVGKIQELKNLISDRLIDLDSALNDIDWIQMREESLKIKEAIQELDAIIYTELQEKIRELKKALHLPEDEKNLNH